MMDEEFVAAVAEIILPVLEPHGFQRIKEPDAAREFSRFLGAELTLEKWRQLAGV